MRSEKFPACIEQSRAIVANKPGHKGIHINRMLCCDNRMNWKMKRRCGMEM